MHPAAAVAALVLSAQARRWPALAGDHPAFMGQISLAVMRDGSNGLVPVGYHHP